MQKNTSQEPVRFLTRNRHRRVWKRVVRVLACIVVFCTTYALILPAITMENKARCGKTEHIHSEECYTQTVSGTRRELHCAEEPHHHTEKCYNETGEIVCGCADYVVHTHEASCYDENGNLWCLLPEVEAHTHGESCYAEAAPVHVHTDACFTMERGVLLCAETGHTHGADCYTETQILVCPVPESDGHWHDLSCYDENGQLICGCEESEGHYHGPECYQTVTELICPLSEEPHQHTEECYAWNQVPVCGQSTEPAERKLTCGKPEIIPHRHTEECFDENGGLICGKLQVPEHVHTEECFRTTENLTCAVPEGEGAHTHSADAGCYNENGNLICQIEESKGHVHGSQCYGTWELTCGLEEHSHSLDCYADPEADVETAEDWEKSFASAELTGNWREDVLAIAKTQLGYMESETNYKVGEDGSTKKGYTRYGAWYGDPYGDWCAMFVSFCVHYADIPEEAFPRDAACAQWVEKLQSSGRYAAAADGYKPLAGDVAFFDQNGDGSPDHAGLVAEVTQDGEGALAEIKTIEGNTGDEVKYVTYYLREILVCGYGILPENPALAEPDEIVSDGNENLQTLTYEGPDYTVAVTYGEDAKLPDGVELRAEEYSRDSENYRTRCEEASALYGWTEEERAAFRLFNIGLYLEGEEVKPAAEVKVTVTYPEVDGEKSCQVTHFAEQPEPVYAAATCVDGTQKVDFAANSFSDYGIMLAAPRAASYHPAGASTHNWPISGATLYNVDTAGQNPAPLSGVTYTVYDQNGTEVKRFTTGNDYVLSMDGLVPGTTYTIEQTAVPPGYMVVKQKREFTVPQGNGWASPGIFYVYSTRDYEPGKTAQVKDYANRIYEETLTALSGDYDAQIGTGNFNFVVDQSNSMLFPARLTPTGRSVTLYRASTYGGNTTRYNDSRGNSDRMYAALAGLDTGKLYYIIAQKSTKATVYALWRSDRGEWYYQDASSYAKASGGNGRFSDVEDSKWIDGGTCLNGEKTPKNNQFGFTVGYDYLVRSDLGDDLNNNGGVATYEIYTGSAYDRLSYLKYALTQMVYQLAALNPQNQVTITTFDANLEKCETQTLSPGGVDSLIKLVSGINTSGGTAQNKGLRHVIGWEAGAGHTKNHLDNSKPNYVVLITDGALNPATESGWDAAGKWVEGTKDSLKGAATAIRNTSNTTLMTVGLSVQNVDLAQTLLKDVYNGGIASPGWSFLDQEADEFAYTMQNALVKNLITLTKKIV